MGHLRLEMTNLVTPFFRLMVSTSNEIKFRISNFGLSVALDRVQFFEYFQLFEYLELKEQLFLLFNDLLNAKLKSLTLN